MSLRGLKGKKQRKELYAILDNPHHPEHKLVVERVMKLEELKKKKKKALTQASR